MTTHMFWGPGWWIVGSFLWLAFWVAVILVIVGLVRGGRSPAAAGGSSMTPALRILEERYARGEIDREEFLERRAVLAGEIPPPPPPPASTAQEPTQPN